MQSNSLEKKTGKTMMDELFEKHGRMAFEKARRSVLRRDIGYRPLYEAMRYFLEEIWYGVQHPCLISLACSAVGGNEENTIHIGGAMLLLAGAVDIHDDIIDNSETKGSKLTVFGKFGKNLTLIVGDVLLIKGLMILHEACQDLPVKKRNRIMALIEKASFELSSAEAIEMNLKGRLDLPLKEYINVIKMKASIAEAEAKIGAIIGCGTKREIRILGQYGKTLGILTTIRDDFIDIFEPDELANRLSNECLPLPLLYALRDKRIRKTTIALLRKERLTERETYQLVDLIWDIKQVQNLKHRMRKLMEESLAALETIQQSDASAQLSNILRIVMEDLE